MIKAWLQVGLVHFVIINTIGYFKSVTQLTILMCNACWVSWGVFGVVPLTKYYKFNSEQ